MTKNWQENTKKGEKGPEMDKDKNNNNKIKKQKDVTKA